MRTFLVQTRNLRRLPLGHQADKYLSLFLDPLKKKDVVLSIVKSMEGEFRNVVAGRSSVLRKTHTFIQNFPDGKEKGEFVGIHFAEGVLNMAGIKVDKSTTLASVYESVVVPEEERLLRGTERVLFVVKSLKNFVRRVRLDELPVVGSTWNLGVNYGYLQVDGRFGLTSLHSQSWPDEYNFTGQPVRMLGLGKQIVNAAESIGFDLDIKGFLHTPEAVFLDCIWKHVEAVGSLSLRHRCTSCVKAKTSEVGKISYRDQDKPSILIKIFWESFGDDGILDVILNEFDRQVDQTSRFPGKNLFQKIVSEEYIIKLVRVVLLALTEQGLIFKSNVNNKNRLTNYVQELTHCISTLSRSYSRGMGDQLIRTFRFDSLNVEETFLITRVVDAISCRAALMLGMIVSVCMRNTSFPFDRPVFFIDGDHTEIEMQGIKSALKYILELYGDERGSKGRVLFTTQSQVFGAAVLAAVYTKNPFDYDDDYTA